MALTERNQLILFGGPILAGVVAYAGWRIARKKKDKDAEGQAGQAADSLPIRQAQLLRAAFNPSGASWLIQTDGTSNENVFKVAAGIKDFPAVATAYKKLYDQNISDDLTNELTPEQLQKFYDLVRTSKLDENFAFKISDDLASNPRAGFTKVAYYAPLVSNTPLKILYWHTKPGAYLGKVIFRTKVLMTTGGVKKYLDMYGVNQVPLPNYKPTNVLYVFGSEVKKLSR